MGTLKLLKEKSNQNSFDKKVLSAIQHLHPYVKHRLYIAESTRIIPKNMYHSNGIIDEGIVNLYENGYDVDATDLDIKLNLFSLVDENLDELFLKEAFHKNTISTHTILQEELDGLEEIFTVDADLDYIMKEELNDISYKQEDEHKHLFLYADKNSTLLKAFKVENISNLAPKKLLGNFYTWVPLNASKIIDFYVFGKLSFTEIAKIMQIDNSRVEKVINAVQKSFRKNLL